MPTVAPPPPLPALSVLSGAIAQALAHPLTPKGLREALPLLLLHLEDQNRRLSVIEGIAGIAPDPIPDQDRAGG